MKMFERLKEYSFEDYLRQGGKIFVSLLGAEILLAPTYMLLTALTSNNVFSIIFVVYILLISRVFVTGIIYLVFFGGNQD